MAFQLHRYSKYLAYGIPLLIMLLAVALSFSSLLQSHPELAIGITYDLALTAPLVYLILIRKKKIPNTSVVAVFVLGLLTANYVLPQSLHTHLNLLKTYVLPIAELAVLSFAFYRVHKTRRLFKTKYQVEADFYAALRKTLIELVDNSKLGNFLATEIGMFYYCLFAWIPKKLTSKQFSNYKDNGAIGLFGALIFIVLSETYVVHILVVKWSATVAWILSISSIYFGMQLFGHAKAMMHRPLEIGPQSLLLRYGLFQDNYIPYHSIEKIVPCSAAIQEENKTTKKLSFFLEAPNVAIYFKSKQPIAKLYGMEMECDILLLNSDAKNNFIEQINKKLAETAATNPSN